MRTLVRANLRPGSARLPTGPLRTNTTVFIARSADGSSASGRRTRRACGSWATSRSGRSTPDSSASGCPRPTSGSARSPRGSSRRATTTASKCAGKGGMASASPRMRATSCRIPRRTSSAPRSTSRNTRGKTRLPRPSSRRLSSTRHMSAWVAKKKESTPTQSSATRCFRASRRPATTSSS